MSRNLHPGDDHISLAQGDLFSETFVVAAHMSLTRCSTAPVSHRTRANRSCTKSHLRSCVSCEERARSLPRNRRSTHIETSVKTTRAGRSSDKSRPRRPACLSTASADAPHHGCDGQPGTVPGFRESAYPAESQYTASLTAAGRQRAGGAIPQRHHCAWVGRWRLRTQPGTPHVRIPPLTLAARSSIP